MTPKEMRQKLAEAELAYANMERDFNGLIERTDERRRGFEKLLEKERNWNKRAIYRLSAMGLSNTIGHLEETLVTWRQIIALHDGVVSSLERIEEIASRVPHMEKSDKIVEEAENEVKRLKEIRKQLEKQNEQAKEAANPKPPREGVYE